MRIAEVIGKVTLSRRHESLSGATWVLATPLMPEAFVKGNKSAGREEPFIVFDELGAGIGSIIAVSEGAEASAPFHPNVKPIDAYNAAILDTVDIET